MGLAPIMASSLLSEHKETVLNAYEKIRGTLEEGFMNTTTLTPLEAEALAILCMSERIYNSNFHFENQRNHVHIQLLQLAAPTYSFFVIAE